MHSAKSSFTTAGFSATRRLRILLRLVGLAVTALRAYALRSLFVIAAVALGIASLTVIVAAVDGAQRMAVEITDRFGPDAAFILGGDIFNRPVGQRVLTLTWEDVRRLRQSLPGAYLVVPMRSAGDITLKRGNRNLRIDRAIGATENYASSWNWPLAEGRDLSPEDVERAAKVCLIGDNAAQELFDEESPVGKTIFVNSIPFQIVGRLTPRGMSGGGGNLDDRIIMPLTTLAQRFNLDRNNFRALRIKFVNPEYMQSHKANLRSFLRHLHGLDPDEPDDFSILTADEVLEFLSMLKGSLILFLGVTATVAMVVGGFVLANLFYLSISERREEIGLRRALGARSSAILIQFLTEALILTLCGAAGGVLLGLALSKTLVQLNILEIHLSWKIFTYAALSAVAIGLIFGLRPARKAAAMDPIAALKGGE